MNTTLIYVIGGLILGGVLIAVLLLLRLVEQSQKKKKDEEPQIALLNQNLQGMQNSFNERIDNMGKFFGKFANSLGQVQEMGTQMSRQMKDFQDFLHSPKLRGNLGERVLRDILEQALPKSHFSIQHQFRDGTMVDAIIKTKKGVIPIDSKFPIDNFRKYHRAQKKEERILHKKEFLRDAKKHVEDIAQKYIKPEENTVDFALMYIPSEPIYYELAIKNTDFVNFAQEKHVFLVSPNIFSFYLYTVLMGLEGQKIEEKTKIILNGLKALKHDTHKFGGDLRLLNKHLNNAKNSMDNVNSGYTNIEGRVRSFEAIESEEKPKEIKEIKEEIKILK